MQFCNQRIDLLENELALLNQSLQSLKSAKVQTDEDYLKEKIRAETLVQAMGNKDEMILEMEKSLSFQQKKIQEL